MIRMSKLFFVGLTFLAPFYMRAFSEVKQQGKSKNSSKAIQKIYNAAKCADARECLRLIEQGVDVNSEHDGDIRTTRKTPLHAAVREYDEKNEEAYLLTINVLIDARADVNKQDSDGCIPLFIAASKGNAHVCRLLLASGAGKVLNQANTQNELPIWKIFYVDLPEEEKQNLYVLFFAYGANPAAIDNNAWRPVQIQQLQYLKMYKDDFYRESRKRASCIEAIIKSKLNLINDLVPIVMGYIDFTYEGAVKELNTEAESNMTTEAINRRREELYKMVVQTKRAVRKAPTIITSTTGDECAIL